MPVNRRDFLQAVGATAVALTAPTSFGDQTPPKQPNIIMLVADDHRGDAMGFLGHPDVKTPHMDDMAAKGTSFPKSFNMGGNQGGVCVPARAMIHQGRPYFRAPDQMKGNAVIGDRSVSGMRIYASAVAVCNIFYARVRRVSIYRVDLVDVLRFFVCGK